MRWMRRFLAALPPDIQKDALSQAKSILESARSSMLLNRKRAIESKKVALDRAEKQKKEELLKEKNEGKMGTVKRSLGYCKEDLENHPRIELRCPI